MELRRLGFFLVFMLVFYLHAWKYQRHARQAEQELIQAWSQADIGQKQPRLERIPKTLKKHADMMRAKSRSYSALSTSDSASHTH